MRTAEPYTLCNCNIFPVVCPLSLSQASGLDDEAYKLGMAQAEEDEEGLENLFEFQSKEQRK